jgi:hypothetical protein
VTDADASAREISASSYSFADSLLPNTGLERLRTPSLPGSDGTLKCSVDCGLAFGTFVTPRSELLASNTADVSTRKTTDSAGHAMGVGGMVVVERLEPDASGWLTNWVVVSERTIDENGSHSWSLARRRTPPGCRMTSTVSRALGPRQIFLPIHDLRPKRRPG